MEIVDHRLIGALHLLVEDHDASLLDSDDGAFQTSTIEALLDGQYEGDLGVGELLQHGNLGIGTVDHLDGELVVIDGEAFVVGASGEVRRVGDGESTPFAVVCWFEPEDRVELGSLHGFEAITAAIDGIEPDLSRVAAVRIDGHFASARVRSVARQEPPYIPLREVVAHQSEWTLHDVEGSVVGFRFPDRTAGLEVAGWHLHLLSADRNVGGHVIDLDLTRGTAQVETLTDLHVELPEAVPLPDLAAAAGRTAEIEAVEGRSQD